MHSVENNTFQDDDCVGLARLLIALNLAGYTGKSSYDRAYRAVVNGAIPAVSAPGAGSRYEIRRSDFPTAAAVLGLKPPAAPGLDPHTAAVEHVSA